MTSTPDPGGTLRDWLARRGRHVPVDRPRRSWRSVVLLLGLLALGSGAAGVTQLWHIWVAAPLAGAAHAIDGDTLAIDGVHVRLWGIDAPELHQGCPRDDADWPAGAAARRGLAAMVEGHRVACRDRGSDHDRRIATCAVDGRDLGAALVEAGLAWDYPRYSRGAYRDAEAAARGAGRGVWTSGTACRTPWDWRHARG